MAPRKKLIEVALPLEAINRESARENYIYKGNPSSIHKWWAQRPLAACRAMLFASLVDDPEYDPDAAKLSGETREQWIGEERARLHRLIEELVVWENSNTPKVIHAARAEIARCVASSRVEKGESSLNQVLPGGATVRDLIQRGRADLRDPRRHAETLARLPSAESVNAFLCQHAPPVYDPFCGGGSIPLEAQRLGLRAYASDLNPVAVLITKALIEIPPKFTNQSPTNLEARARLGTASYHGAQGLAEDVRYYSRWLRNEAIKRIGHL
jgi:putative DNA methylase